MTKKMLVDNPGLEFALVQIFGKLGDKAQPQTDVVSEDSSPSLVQECVIEVTRYGENGEPLTVKVLGSAKHTYDSRTWVGCSEAEVVETNGDFHESEVIQLSPEEQLEVATQAEREWLND